MTGADLSGEGPERPTDRGDADLAVAAAGGDRAALGALYDRYAPRVYALAARQLRDRDAAADVTQETFVLAAQRLAGLREPDRVRSWLFAIARHQVVDHVRRAGRVVPTDSIEDIDMPTDTTEAFDRVHAAELRTLLSDTGAGLDERDRLVLELAYAEELAGTELAAALGVRENTAHQLLSRARTRLRTSLGALLVARQGRDDCDDLRQLLAGWDGGFSTVWRKRVARHVDRCDVCTERQRMALSPAALGAALPVLALPPSLREEVLEIAHTAAVPATAGGRAEAGEHPVWQADGFPPPDDLGVLARLGAARSPTPTQLAAGRPWATTTLLAAVVVVALGVVAGVRALTDPGAATADAPAPPPLVDTAITSTGAEPTTGATSGATTEPQAAVPTGSVPETGPEAPPAAPEPPPESPPTGPPEEPPVDPAPVLVVQPATVSLPRVAGRAVVDVTHTSPEAVSVRVDASGGLVVDPLTLAIPPGGSASLVVTWADPSVAPASAEVSLTAPGVTPATLTVLLDEPPSPQPGASSLQLGGEGAGSS